MPSEYEDKYLLLRDENTELKKKKNEQEVTIKRMYTKLAIIEEKLPKTRQGEGMNNKDDPEMGSNKVSIVPVRRDLDTEKFIAALKSDNVTLRKKNQMLVEKNLWLIEKCRQSSATKRRESRQMMQKRLAVVNIGKSGGCTGNTLGKETESARKLHRRETFSEDLEVALKKRLVAAEKQLVKLRSENEQLRRSGGRVQLNTGRDNNEAFGSIDNEEEGIADNKGLANVELDQLKRELKDRQAQLAILHARYDNLESNALAEREIQEKTLGQMEQINRQVHKLRMQLQDTIMEKEELELRVVKACDQQSDNELLRQQNRRLEERMTLLCESPFINDAFQRKERIDKLFALEKATQEQKATISCLKEENQKLQGALRELQYSIGQLKKAKDGVEQDLAKMAHHLVEERNAKSFEPIISTNTSDSESRPKSVPSFYSRTQGPQYQSLDTRDACSSPVNNNVAPDRKSVSFVNVGGGVASRKYGDQPTTAAFLESTADEKGNVVKHLRNRVHVLQIAHLKAMQELERCEKMLHAQTDINRELALEIEEITMSRISSINQLQRQTKDFELLCEERQQRILALQAEVKQLKYARESMFLKMRGANDEDSGDADEEIDVASMSESLVISAQDLAPGEQLLEVEIIGGNFDSNVIGINSSTFILCDFYDFESQSTSLIMGSRPEYNLSAIFKVTVDGFFLRYLASESINLEVHRAVHGDFKLIGKSSLRLSKLLQSKGVVKESRLAINSVSNTESGPAILGTLNINIRLSTPISEIWRVHLRSYPQDIRLLSRSEEKNKIVLPFDAQYRKECSDDASFLTNELQITVFACRNLHSYGRTFDGSIALNPSSYAHYQLLGFPDVFTNIVPETASPKYDLKCSRQAFALKVDACLLRFLSKSHLVITVFDDQADLDEAGDGTVGRCELLMSDLVHGEIIRGWFPLVDQNERHVGDVSVLIQWKDPFQILCLTSSQRARGVNGPPADTHSLDYDQQHALMSMFSANVDGRVDYRQFLNYAAPSEELELLIAKIKERFEYAMDAELITSVKDAIISEMGEKEQNRMLIPIAVIAQFGEKYGIFLSDLERDLLQLTFGTDVITESRSVVGFGATEDRNTCEKLIAVDYLLLHVNPRRSCSERLLCHKVRQTLRRYVEERRKQNTFDSASACTLFKKVDEAMCGRITRSAFRKCLSALGFDLMDLDSEYCELVQSQTKQSCLSEILSEKPSDFTTAKVALQRQDPDDVFINAEQHPKRLVKFINDTRLNTEKDDNAQALVDLSFNTKSVPAIFEFRRRKQAFLERMKAIACASSKSLVYEHMEKRFEGKPIQAGDRKYDELSQRRRIEDRVRQLHTPHNLHHEAARMLQKQFRQYKERQQDYRETKSVKTSIIEADFQLQRILSKWTPADLSRLEVSVLAEIKRDIPEATRTKLLTRKQLAYFLSKISPLALPSALLCQIMDFFSADKSGLVAYQPFLEFIFSTSTEISEREKTQRLSVLRRLFFDVGYASYIFMSIGDLKGSGLISYKNFHEGLSRLGVQLSYKELHLLTSMFDANGHEILYHALFHVLTQLPHYQHLVVALKRCRSVGISYLREKLLTFVNSDDGYITREDLLQILMQQSSKGTQFETTDASLLCQMVDGSDDTITRVSIRNLCLRLEAAIKHNSSSTAYDWNKYNMQYLQRLAQNCRKFICEGFAKLRYEFERFDWQKQGLVSYVTFVSIAHHKGFLLLTEDQIKCVAKRFGVKTNNSYGINYLQFLKWTTPPPPADIDAVEKKLRETAQEQAMKLPSKQLSEVFSNWNQIFEMGTGPTSKGVMSRSDFVRICNGCLNLPLDENEMRLLLYTYDPELKDQIDLKSFLQLNWREAKITYQNQTEAMNAEKEKSVMSKIRGKLQDEVNASEEVDESFNESSSNACVECGKFVPAMRKLETFLSPSEAKSLFIAFGEQPDIKKVDFVRFSKKLFNLHVLKSSKSKLDCQLSFENEQQLRCSLDAAVNNFPLEFRTGFDQFHEFCVLHRFAEVSPFKLWSQMEANGLVNILTKRTIGLLLQKFSATLYEDSGDLSSNVSLKALYVHLKSYLSSLPIIGTKQDTSSKSTKLITSGTKPKAAITVLSDLVDSCDERGVDFRAEFEACDNLYTGYVSAMELKGILLRLDIAKYASSSSAETLIGQLVRQFRSDEETDAVRYTKMLYEATERSWINSDVRWFDQSTELLRSRVRLMANLAGQINHNDDTIYAKLDAAFSHFDREDKGFLTAMSVIDGFRVLNYDLAPAQVSMLMLKMCVFRHDGGGLSRAEFDSFVLDPYAARLLKTLSKSLYSNQKGSQDRDKKPRVAYLSLLLMEFEHSHQSSLLTEIFLTQLERALERQITALEKRRLEHLFDVNRNGTIAYKLFLKVMSQWRTPSVASPENGLADGCSIAEQRQVNFFEQSKTAKPEKRCQSPEFSTNDITPCTCDAILWSLYNQMSSIDFDSQLEIVGEYLRVNDLRHSGSIEVKQLKGIFDQIGLSLSINALMNLQLYFPGPAASKAEEIVEKFIAYKKVLLALKALHKTSDDK